MVRVQDLRGRCRFGLFADPGGGNSGEIWLLATITGGFVGAPLVHHLQGETANAWTSFLVRGVFSAGAIGLGFATADKDSFLYSPLLNVITGSLVGLSIASIADAIFIARKQVPIENESAWTWRPYLQARSGNTLYGVGGTF